MLETKEETTLEQSKEEVLTSNAKNKIMKVTIREFRNNFSQYWKIVSEGKVVVVYNRERPVLIVSPYKTE